MLFKKKCHVCVGKQSVFNYIKKNILLKMRPLLWNDQIWPYQYFWDTLYPTFAFFIGVCLFWKGSRRTSWMCSTSVSWLFGVKWYVPVKALVRSKKLLALSDQPEILSPARASAQFYGNLALSLALNNRRAPLNFALISKICLKILCMK